MYKQYFYRHLVEIADFKRAIRGLYIKSKGDNNMRFAIIVIFILGFCVPTFAAKVRIEIPEDVMPSIHIDGEIDQRTPQQIETAIKEIKTVISNRNLPRETELRMALMLKSEGGDVEAAIAVGIIARQYNMMTMIEKDGICASACALTFLGGVNRVTLSGKYGIHRPYSTRYTNSNTDAKLSYNKINKLVGDYLEQMNITPRLLEAMNAVPPGKIRWLKDNELKDMGIDGIDPVHSDLRNSDLAKRLGITKSELYARKQKAEKDCAHFLKPEPTTEKGLKEYLEGINNQLDCYYDIVYGAHSEPRYRIVPK